MNSTGRWKGILHKLAELRNLDRQCQAFGAEVHRYELRPVLSPQELEWAEEALGAALPEELRTFYLEVGDGGAGPAYGLYPSGELNGYRPAHPYPGLEGLTQAALAAGWNPQEEECLRVPGESMAGVAGISDEGCGGETCLVLNGPQAGQLVHFSGDGYFAETGKTLGQSYAAWLDEALRQFRAVEAWMRAGATLQEIKAKLREQVDWVCDAGSMIASIANVPKPVELFGDPRHGSRIVHGAIQTPWYEDVLSDWQERNLGG